MPNVVTANRLIDGIVVYLTSSGGWTEDIADARSRRDRGRDQGAGGEGGKAVRARRSSSLFTPCRSR